MATKTAESKLSISYYGAFEGDLWDAYMKGAKNPAISEKFAFFHTSDTSCGSGISLTRDFDESPLAYAGGMSEDEIVEWAKGSSVPRLITFSEDYIEPIFGDQNNAVILFTEETGTAYQAAFEQASKDLQGQILFVTSGVSDGIQSRLGEFIGVTKDNMPTMRIVSPGAEMLKFVWEGDVNALSTADVSKFVGDFNAGSLAPHLKSEDIPEQNPVEGLTTLVGKNWESIVKDPSKDVLVKYYAPWCGHCKALAPVWDELAKDVESVDDLVIAKFDSTANEVQGLEVRGYPTLKFYPKDNKDGVDFAGDRQLADFQLYLLEHSTAYQAFRPANPGAGNEEL